MNFREAESYLLSLGNEVSAMKLGLENIRALLDALGNPQNKYKKVQVAGTNGKGSVCVFLNSICVHAGIKTGLYTSPHLVSITERIKIEGVDVSEEEFAAIASFVRKTSEQLVAEGSLETVPTYFEQVTAIALVAFANHDVELVILETGLGGRLDATTAANAEIAVITRIDLDHEEYLGDTLAEIAAEKAAIIWADSRVVVGEQKTEAMEVILDRCRNVGVIPQSDCEVSYWAIDMLNHSVVASFRTARGLYDDPNLGLKGRYQLENARIAVMVSETLAFDFGFPISPDDVVDGLEDARYPGRLEYVDRFLFDGAHNVGGAKALRDYLDEFVQQEIIMIFGVMNDKDIAGIAEILFPKADKLVLTQAENTRAMPVAGLSKCVPAETDKGDVYQTDSVAEAIDKALEITPSDGVILVTGSLYLVGEVKKLLNN